MSPVPVLCRTYGSGCGQSPLRSNQGKGPRSEPGVHSMLRICVALLARQFPVYFASASAMLGNGQRERPGREGGLFTTSEFSHLGLSELPPFGVIQLSSTKRLVTKSRSPNNLALSQVVRHSPPRPLTSTKALRTGQIR
jgi:hypothetical protein